MTGGERLEWAYFALISEAKLLNDRMEPGHRSILGRQAPALLAGRAGVSRSALLLLHLTAAATQPT